MTQPRSLTPLGLAMSLSLFGDLTLYAVLVTQLDGVGLSLGAAGVMLGVNRLIRIPGNPLAGFLLDRWGRRHLFILGMLLGVFSTASYGLVRGFWPFLVGRLAWGIAWTLINVGGMAMVLDLSIQSNRGRLMGIYNAWQMAGLAISPLVGGFLVDAIGFRPAMLVCAGLTAAGLAVAALALPETSLPGHPPLKGAGDAERRDGTPSGLAPLVLFKGWQTHLRANRGLVTAAGLFLIIQFAGEGLVLSTASLLLKQHFGPSIALGSMALGVASAGGILLALRSLLASVIGPPAGHLSDGHTGRWPVIAGSLALGMLGFGLLASATSLWLVVLGVAVGAISTGAVAAALTAYVGDLTPPGRQGVVMGAYATAGDLGSTAGPFLAFALLAVLDLRWVYWLCTLAFLAGLWLIWDLHSQNLRSQKEIIQ
jgi:MFS family permease